MTFKRGDENYSRTIGSWNKNSRNWKQEIAQVASRLQMCVIFPDNLTARTRIKCSCIHGFVINTTVHRFISRRFCCRSQASKAHDPEMKRKAARIAWDKSKDLMIKRQQERWSRPGEKEKHSKIMISALGNLRKEGWFNPGYGYGPGEEERTLPGILYLIRYLDESGTHFKLGITKLPLRERFRKDRLISIIYFHYGSLGECFDLEQSLLKWAKQHGYRYSSPTTTELIHPAGISHILSKLNKYPSM